MYAKVRLESNSKELKISKLVKQELGKQESALTMKYESIMRWNIAVRKKSWGFAIEIAKCFLNYRINQKTIRNLDRKRGKKTTEIGFIIWDKSRRKSRHKETTAAQLQPSNRLGANVQTPTRFVKGNSKKVMEKLNFVNVQKYKNDTVFQILANHGSDEIQENDRRKPSWNTLLIITSIISDVIYYVGM